MKLYGNIYFAILIIIIVVIIYVLAVNETIREEVFGWMLKTPIEANAIFKDQLINGSITFKEDLEAGDTIVEVNLKGTMPDGKHGLIIYQLGDISENSESLGEHYNPYGKLHGDLNSGHSGDLGNIEFKDGESKHLFRIKKLKIRGINSVIGRGIVLHENEDDLGSSNDSDSKKTGNVGNTLAYTIIGYSRV